MRACSRLGRVAAGVTSLVTLVALATGCSSSPTTSALSSPGPQSGAGTTGAAPTPSPTPLPPVTPVTPTLEAAFSGSFSQAQIQAVAKVQGVVAAAGVNLSYVTADTPSGTKQLSLAVVDPLIFRPLAPGVTAQAAFVWQGLLQGEIYLAHEEQPVLGVALGSKLPLKGPLASIDPVIGGLAANGVPNIAEAIIADPQGAELGLPGPTELIIATTPGANVTTISAAVGKALPQATVTPLVTLVSKALLSGPASARLLGSFNYTPNPDGSINEDSSWVRANIVTRSVPILGQVTCNKLMFNQLSGALQDLQNQGLANLINVAEYHQHVGNCWQPRYVDSDPSRGISLHAWGIAVDLNRNENPEGGANHQDPRLIATFQRWGFRWGGVFYPPDPMHFELAGIMQ